MTTLCVVSLPRYRLWLFAAPMARLNSHAAERELQHRLTQRAEALDHMRAGARRKPKTRPDAPGADVLWPKAT